jgi:YfiH family protein
MRMPSALFLTSPLLQGSGFRHAFFLRHRGWSTGPYDSLNFSVDVGDRPTAVTANLGLAAVELGVEPDRLCWMRQVHGNGVLVLEAGTRSAQVQRQSADALVATDPQLACGVRTADCVPILVADRASGAVGAVHAGWRGIVAGAVTAAVGRLRSLVGGRGDLVAAIGPHISQPAFEVSEDVADLLRACARSESVVHQAAGRITVDLGRIVRSQLMDLGLGAPQIDHVGGCTVLEPEHYFSYRRDGRRSGRHLSAIVPRSA